MGQWTPSEITDRERAEFAARPRFSEDVARAGLLRDSNVVTHLLDNEDGTFSLMSHINCEWCDYCSTQGDCRGNANAVAAPAKIRPYEQNNPEYYTRYAEDGAA